MEEPVIDQQPSAAKNSNKLVWWVAGAGCLVALCFCLALGGVGAYGIFTQRAALSATATAFAFHPAIVMTPVDFHTHPKPNGASLGDPNAPVKVVMYSDFQCPFCRFFWEDTEDKLFADYVATGKVHFTYRSMGLFLGEESLRAAEAAYCAGDQEKFWEYHDVLFANQAGENQGAFSDERLAGFAQNLGLDMGVFDACFTSGKYAERAQKDKTEALASGVDSTPTILINGEKIVGAQDYDAYAQAIERALAEVGGG